MAALLLQEKSHSAMLERQQVWKEVAVQREAALRELEVKRIEVSQRMSHGKKENEILKGGLRASHRAGQLEKSGPLREGEPKGWSTVLVTTLDGLRNIEKTRKSGL
jgi:hypothetical protein